MVTFAVLVGVFLALSTTVSLIGWRVALRQRDALLRGEPMPFRIAAIRNTHVGGSVYQVKDTGSVTITGTGVANTGVMVRPSPDRDSPPPPPVGAVALALREVRDSLRNLDGGYDGDISRVKAVAVTYEAAGRRGIKL